MSYVEILTFFGSLENESIKNENAFLTQRPSTIGG